MTTTKIIQINASDIIRDRKAVVDSKVNSVGIPLSDHHYIYPWFPPANILSFRILSYNIPHKWPNVDANWGHRLEFAEYDGGHPSTGGTLIAQVTIDFAITDVIGHYNIPQFLAMVESGFNNYSVAGRTYVVSINPNTDILTIKSSGGVFAVFSNEPEGICRQLGIGFGGNGGIDGGAKFSDNDSVFTGEWPYSCSWNTNH